MNAFDKQTEHKQQEINLAAMQRQEMYDALTDREGIFTVEKLQIILQGLIFIGCVLLILVVNMKALGKLHTVLTMTAVLLSLASFLISAGTKVIIRGGEITKRTLFLTKTIKLSDVLEVTKLSLKGRYVFMFITEESFVMVSTIIKDFPIFTDLVLEHLPEAAKSGLTSVAKEDIAGKKRIMRAILGLILVCIVAANVYILYRY